MLKKITKYILSLVLILQSVVIYGQTSPGVMHQLEQEACGAFVICSDTFYNYKRYIGVGVLWEPIPVPFGSEDSFRENSHWVVMDIAESGYLAFDLIPHDVRDFYQFQLFRSSDKNCLNTAAAFTLVRGEVNRRGVYGTVDNHITGIKLDESEIHLNKAAPLFVNAGERYFMRILSASEYKVITEILSIALPSRAGYSLDFKKKTCKFEKGPPPLMTGVSSSDCNNSNFLDIQFNRNINCSSIDINGTDLYITPPIDIQGVTGSGCTLGEGTTSKLRVYFEEELPPGDYILNVKTGDDGNTFLDICYDETPLPHSIPFTVQKLKDTVDIYICKGALPYTWNGMTFHEAGELLAAYKSPNSNGCDSTTYINLYTVDSFVHYENIFACDEALPYTWYDGKTSSSYGERVLRHVFFASGGCDSIIYLNIIPQEITYHDSAIFDCETVTINGQSFSASTTYTDTVYNSLGCKDSIINYNINILPPLAIKDVFIDTGGCSYLVIDDKLFYSDSLLTDTLRTWYGCDSVYVHYDVQISPGVEPDMKRSYISSCDSFIVNGLMVYNDTILEFLYKNAYGCDSLVERFYVNIDTLSIELISLPSYPVVGEYIQVYVASEQPDVSILYWEPAVLFPLQNATKQVFRIESPVTMAVMAEDQRGCRAVDTLVIGELDTLVKNVLVPTAFTPNGDGLNDVFSLSFANERARVLKHVYIYDRWGKIVFSDYGGFNFYWNGRYGNNGPLADPGVFFYDILIEYTDGELQQIKGDVTLLR